LSKNEFVLLLLRRESTENAERNLLVNQSSAGGSQVGAANIVQPSFASRLERDFWGISVDLELPY
jgi:hypothetical protein